MLRYFKNIRNSLCDDGLLFLDSFGGYEAHKVQTEKRKLDGFTFLWEQKQYNAVTGEMHCRIHFRFPGGRKIDNAFSYVWRLWGAREIREVLIDAGFYDDGEAWISNKVSPVPDPKLRILGRLPGLEPEPQSPESRSPESHSKED